MAFNLFSNGVLSKVMYAINPALGLSGDVFNSVFGNDINQQMVDIQKQANADNLALAREQFDYTKMLNQNKFQMQSSDMRSAGINPLAGVGASMSTFSGSAGQSGVGLNPSQAPSILSGLMNMAIAKMNNRTQERIAENSNETQERIADKANESSESIANLNATLQREAHLTEKDISNAQILSNEKISRLDRQSQERIESDKLKIQDTLTRFVEQNKLILQSRDFDNSVSDDRQAFEQSLLKFKNELDETLEKNRELRNSITLPAQYFSDGKEHTLTLAQASAFMQNYVTVLHNNPSQTALDNFCKLLGSFTGFFGLTK